VQDGVRVGIAQRQTRAAANGARAAASVPQADEDEDLATGTVRGDGDDECAGRASGDAVGRRTRCRGASLRGSSYRGASRRATSGCGEYGRNNRNRESNPARHSPVTS
jgi:hypothetical protein